jgi:hypothetical protein
MDAPGNMPKPEVPPGCTVEWSPGFGAWAVQNEFGQCYLVDPLPEHLPRSLEERIETLLKEPHLRRLTEDQEELVRRALPLALKYLQEGGVP